MKSYSPTIETLKNKAPKELHAIFRKAASDVACRDKPAEERIAAEQTIEAIRKCFMSSK